MVTQAPTTDITIRAIPKESYAKYSTFLGMQTVLFELDQKSSGQNVQSAASKPRM